MDYSKFKHITLHDTGLFYGTPKIEVVHKRLKDNGINTLQDLFEKYDDNTIYYGTNNNKGSFYKEEIKGVIELLRFKYLGVSLNFDPNKNLFTSFFEG